MVVRTTQLSVLVVEAESQLLPSSERAA